MATSPVDCHQADCLDQWFAYVRTDDLGYIAVRQGTFLLIAHVASITFTLMIYLFLGAAYFGWGKVASVILRIGEQKSDFGVMPIWMGWAFTLFVFQIVHFFLPITATLVIPIFALGAVISIPQIVRALRRFSQQRTTLTKTIVVVILAMGLSAWLASRAMLPPTDYDSGLYHLSAIRWINTYPVVPGLGNLHGRLAFNPSFLTYVAALNLHPLFGYGRSLANSFLFLLVVATSFPLLRSAQRQPSHLTKKHPFDYASTLFLVPFLVYLALSSTGIASPTPDFASTLLQLAMFILVVQGLAEWMNGQRNQDYRLIVLVVLATTAVTIKLSNLGFSAVIFGFSLVYTWKASPRAFRGVVRFLIPAVALFLVWGLQGIMLSGAPFYPSTIGYISVEWAVPREEVSAMANLIFGWARQPETHWSLVLGNWNWIESWIRKISSDIVGVVYPLAISVVFWVIAMIVGTLPSVKRNRRVRRWDWTILIPSVLGLIYWFFTAPEPRFAHALFNITAISSSLLLLSRLQDLHGKRLYLAILGIVFVACNFLFLVYPFVHGWQISSISTSGWHSIQAVPLTEKVTFSGLSVFTPLDGDQCWDAPLPCTPLFDPTLRLRRAGELESGFIVGRSDSDS